MPGSPAASRSTRHRGSITQDARIIGERNVELFKPLAEYAREQMRELPTGQAAERRRRSFAMRTFSLAVVLSVASVLHAQPPKGAAPKADKAFDDITQRQIKKLIGNGEGMTKIEGSDNKDNKIPQGTILLYVTNENRYGKLKILEYGYNLTIRWVTYDNDGGVFAKGDRLVVKGTWNYDLDYGVEGDEGKSRVDFWWEQVDETNRFWIGQNGAAFLVYEPKK
jgi:hypothetical protein